MKSKFYNEGEKMNYELVLVLGTTISCLIILIVAYYKEHKFMKKEIERIKSIA